MGAIVTPRRVIAGALALAGIACLIAALVIWIPRLAFGKGWNTAEATVVSAELLKNHDRFGRLSFQMQAVFRFPAGQATIRSFYETRDVTRMIHKLQEFPIGSQHTISYRAENPSIARFGPEFRWLNARRPLELTALAALLFIVGLFVLFGSRAHDCTNCGEPLKGYYAYCPACSAAIAQ